MVPLSPLFCVARLRCLYDVADWRFRAWDGRRWKSLEKDSCHRLPHLRLTTFLPTNGNNISKGTEYSFNHWRRSA